MLPSLRPSTPILSLPLCPSLRPSVPTSPSLRCSGAPLLRRSLPCSLPRSLAPSLPRSLAPSLAPSLPRSLALLYLNPTLPLNISLALLLVISVSPSTPFAQTPSPSACYHSSYLPSTFIPQSIPPRLPLPSLPSTSLPPLFPFCQSFTLSCFLLASCISFSPPSYLPSSFHLTFLSSSMIPQVHNARTKMMRRC